MKNKKLFAILPLFFTVVCSQPQTPTVDKLTVKIIPSSISVIGDFSDGVKYTDAEGLHIIIISVLNKGKISEKDWVSEIHATKYSLKNGSFIKEWELSDKSKDLFSEMKYLPNSLKVTDVNIDGILESRFLYMVNHSGDPFTVKYLFHYKNIKYLIYGEVPIGFDESTDCETIISSSFANLPENCASFAKNDWNSTMKETFSCFIVGKH